MSYDKFFYFETVDISNGDTAIVKNYYPANGFVVLYSTESNDTTKITAGMSITGRSSDFTKVLTTWEHSKPENNDLYDNNYNDYAWEADVDLFIYTDDGGMIVMDDKANLPVEIADLQMDNGLILTKFTDG